jgi:FkbM family methyltransferase
VIDKTSGNLFCHLANLRQQAGGRSHTKFYYDRRDGEYYAVQGNHKRFFLQKKRHLHFYFSGLKHRADNLAKAYLLEKLKFENGDTIVDCGANSGDLKLWFDAHKIQIDYIGFEPDPNFFRCLKKNVSPSVVYNEGLFDKNGSLDLFVSSSGGDSSFIEQGKKVSEIVKIPVTRLDLRLDKPIKLLKIEAEGAEPEVIKGAEGLLPKIKWISADVGPERGKNHETTLVPVTNFLLKHGFELFAIGRPRLVALYKNSKLAD